MQKELEVAAEDYSLAYDSAQGNPKSSAKYGFINGAKSPAAREYHYNQFLKEGTLRWVRCSERLPEGSKKVIWRMGVFTGFDDFKNTYGMELEKIEWLEELSSPQLKNNNNG